MLETLFGMFPNVALAEGTLHWHHFGVFRSVGALHVLLGPRAAAGGSRDERPDATN